MTDPAPAEIPVAIERVDRSRGEGGGTRLRLTGRWLGSGKPSDTEPLLVVAVDGRRHRFPASREGDAPDVLPAGRWQATFELPPWAEPRRPGQAAMWVGEAVVPVPPAGSGDTGGPQPVAEAPGPVAPPAATKAAPPRPERPHQRLPAPPALGEATPWPPEPPTRPSVPSAPSVPPSAAPAGPSVPAAGPSVPAAGASVSSASAGEPPEPVFDAGRTGPLAEILFKESISALHVELDQRAAEIARLRGALAETRAELESRTAKQASLEAARGDLHVQVQRLMEAATEQRDESKRRQSTLQERISVAEARQADADRRRSEAEAERERAREQVSELSSAHHRHAADASALREQLAAATISRDAAAGEIAGLQAELERVGSELAVARESLEARGGDPGEAQQLLAEARALTERLRGQSPQ